MRLDQVRSDWTALGSADPLWAVLVSPDGRNRRWSPEDFLATGREEIAGVLAHIEAIGLHPQRARALDLGCGAGRLTHALAAQFEHVVGVDISPTMLETARSLVTDERCEFIENTEPHLHRFADDSFDLAVSSLVLQHLPPDVADQLLSELVRVTRPGGVVVVQVAESPDRSARGLLTRVLPRPAMRWAQQRVLGYPAPMDMWATPFTTVARVAAAGGARIADAVADPMYGGHWRYRRYYLTVAGEPPAPDPAAVPVDVAQAPPPVPPSQPQVSEAASAPPDPEVDDAPRSTGAAAAAWLRVRPERPVWVAALALAVIQTVVRGVLAYRGTFYIDDFAFTGRAAQYGLSPHFLFHPYNSHVMPGSFAWVWLSTKLAPLSYTPVATVDVLLQLLLAVQFYRLLRDLFGTRPAILVPYAVYLFTPVTLPAFVWWAAALNQLPMQLAMIIALRCQLAYLRTGRRSRGVLGAVAVVGGLAFSEKTLLVVPLLVAVTVLYFQTGGPVQRVRRAAVRHRAVWLAHLVVAVPYTAWYLIAVPSPVSSRQAGHEVVSLADTSFREALLPGLLGGPWSWRPIGWAGALAGTSAVASWICFAGVALFVAASIRARRGAVLGWLIVLCYALANFVLLLVSRATFVGAVIGDEYRYITDVAAVAVIGGALALIPLRDGPWVAADPVRLERRSSAPDDAAPAPSALVDTVRVLTVPWRGMAGAAVLAALVTASALVSTVRYDRYWHDNPVRPYLAALKHDLGSAHGPVVLDEGVPEDIAWGLLYPYNLESKVFRPLSDAPSYLAPGQVVEQLDVVAPDGHLRRALVRGPKNLPGKVSNCGWLVQSAPVTVPLFGRTVPGDWVLRMGYIASADATTTLTAGVTRVDVPVRRGLNTLFVRVSGTVTSIRLSGFTGSTSLCTADVTVGTPVAIPGTTVP